MPNYVDFENAQKRREMMEQLRKETEGRDIPGYEEFAKNMKELDELMDSLHPKDNGEADNEAAPDIPGVSYESSETVTVDNDGVIIE